jgi:nucleotide-binding universal stress UspA family protein
VGSPVVYDGEEVTTVLAAVNGEREFDRVVTVGKELAAAYDELLVVVHVMADDEFAQRQSGRPEYYLNTAQEDARGTARGVVRGSLADFEDVELSGEVGDIVNTVVREVGYLDSRYLVVGGKRRSPVGKAVFGDLTQDLMLESTCPVVTVLRDRYEAGDVTRPDGMD